jgi:multisubunit Na+/H+ antiporter MnhF subunit
MNLWLWAALALSLGLVPCGLVLRRARLGDRLLAQQLTSQVVALVLVVLGIGSQQTFLLDLALAVALLSSVGTLLFARFLERWL